NGAALASSAAYLVDSVLLAAVLAKQLNVRWTELIVPTRQDLGLYRDTWRRLAVPSAAHLIGNERTTKLDIAFTELGCAADTAAGSANLAGSSSGDADFHGVFEHTAA